MSKNLSTWSDSIKGKRLDLDGAPANQPQQCHDVWLSRLYSLGGKRGDGHAGTGPDGTGFTSNVYHKFPNYRPGLAQIFTKVPGQNIRRGDIVFWSKYNNVGLPHVAVAMGAPKDGRFLATHQFPGGPVKVEQVFVRGAIGVLRPKDASTNTTPAPAKPATPKPAPAKPAGNTHKVGRGESLSIIAGRHGLTWKELYAANRSVVGNNPNLLKVGVTLVIPKKGASAPARTYTVKRGDTLGAIATRFGTTWQKLASHNNIPNANLIHPGQVIRIP